MKRLAASVFLAFGAATAAEPPPSDPADLVRAMRLDELAATIVNHRAQGAARKGRASRKDADCVATVAPGKLADDLARALPRLLSPDEIRTASAFYATSAGAKVVEHTFRQIDHQLTGSGESPPPPATTPAEDATFDAFAKTEAGRKFVDSGFLLNTAPVEDVVDGGIASALSRCRGAVKTTTRDIVPKSIESPLEREPQSD